MAGDTEGVLLLERDRILARAVARVVRRVVDVFAATVNGEAESALDERSWDAFIVGPSFSVPWLERIRDRGHASPALLLVATSAPSVAERAAALGARTAPAPVRPDILRAFATEVAVRSLSPGTPRPVADALVQLATGEPLSRGELEIITWALSGGSASEYVDARGITTNTYKTRVRRLLRKVRRSSLGEVRDRILRESSRPQTTRSF